ncbi:MAG: S41 family peptidase [Eubacteriales bacterium]|nr:S41 family peptidase [Eubacteriales bacterium]MDD4583458.1 S41 family peptidase [Eubacteriales bacterium]
MLTIKKRNLIFLMIVSLMIGTLVMGGIQATYGHLTNQVDVTEAEYQEYKKLKADYGELSALKKLIEERYYIPVDSEHLYEGIYKGLFWGIGDPYSAYLSKEEYDELMISTTGEYQGIGVTIAPDESGYINVVAPMDGSPADKAGIKSGDKIIAVNGVNFSGKTIDRAAGSMRGAEGTKVGVTILRGDETLEFKLTRAKITLETVKSETFKNGIGYIRISSFEENTAKDFNKALRDMELSEVKGLIVDLRDNPGGLVDVSVEVADLLLPEGIVTYTEDRKGEKKYFKSKAGFTKLPFVLLVNNGSASASEIVAGAVKDFGTGKIVGTTTYGKGIIQEIIPLDNGGATKLTIMQYFSPKGNVIHKVGVKPDYVVESADLQLQKAVEVLL